MFITNTLTNGFSFEKLPKFASKSKRAKLAADHSNEEILIQSQAQRSKMVAKPKSVLAKSLVKATAIVPPPRKFQSPYEDDETFDAALQLYNKQMETTNAGSSASSNSSQKWEYKGEIRVSLQLCVMCDDVGKVKSGRDKYYLDVMEVRKYRTILCKDCLGYILDKHTGRSLSEIQRKMNELIT